jgi:hypothetical protein
MAERIVVQAFQWGLNASSRESKAVPKSTMGDEVNEGAVIGHARKAENAHDIVEESNADMDSDLPPLFPHLEVLHVVPPRRGIRKTDQSSESRSFIEWVDDVDGSVLEDVCRRRGVQVKRDAVRWRACQCHQEDYL